MTISFLLKMHARESARVQRKAQKSTCGLSNFVPGDEWGDASNSVDDRHDEKHVSWDSLLV